MHDKIGSAQPCITKYWEENCFSKKRTCTPHNGHTSAFCHAQYGDYSPTLPPGEPFVVLCNVHVCGSNHTPFGDSYVSFNGGHSKELQERCGEHECIAYNNEYGIHVPPNAYGCRCVQDYGGPLCDVPTYFKNCTDNFCGKRVPRQQLCPAFAMPSFAESSAPGPTARWGALKTIAAPDAAGRRAGNSALLMTVPRNALEPTAAVNAPEKDVRASAQALIAEKGAPVPTAVPQIVATQQTPNTIATTALR